MVDILYPDLSGNGMGAMDLSALVIEPQHLYPESFDSRLRDVEDMDVAPALNAALQYALQISPTIGGGRVQLLRQYKYGSSIIVPAGVTLFGPRGAELMRIDEMQFVTTEAIASGSGFRTFGVQSITGAYVGMEIMLITGAFFSPVDPYNHRGIVVTAVDELNKRMTIYSAANLSGGHAIGTIVQTAARGVILAGDGAKVEGFTINGNQANQEYANWYSHAEVTIEADNCTIDGLLIKNAPAEGVIAAGPQAGLIYSAKIINTDFEFCGTNGIHTGNIDGVLTQGCSFKSINQRRTGINIGHNDGAAIASDNVYNWTFTSNYVKDAVYGFGAYGTTQMDIHGVVTINDQAICNDNTFEDCFNAVNITSASKYIEVCGNRIRCQYNAAGAPNHFGVDGKFASSKAIWISGDVHGAIVTHVNASDNQIERGCISVSHAKRVTLNNNNFDNSDIVTIGDQKGSYELFNCSDVKIDGGYVYGGVYGVFAQSGYAATATSGFGYVIGQMRNIEVKNVTFDNQVFAALSPAILDAAGELDLEFSDNTVKTGPASNVAWVGITLLDSMKALRNKFRYTLGTPILGESRRVQNARDNILNGIITNNWTEPAYVSANHVVIAGANVTVTSLGSGRYECDKSGGVDGLFDTNFHTDTYVNDGDWDLEIEAPGITSRALIGLESGDQTATGVPTNNDLEWALNLFDGQTFHYSLANAGNVSLNAPLTGGNFIAGDKLRIGRRGSSISYRKGGANFDAATVLYTSPLIINNLTKLRLRGIIRTSAGNWIVKLFG